MTKDSLGDRMKGYENVTRHYLMRRGYTIIRVDGKAFHTYTRGLKRPFDQHLIDDMNDTAIALCEGIQGTKMAYVQSDEISLVITDFDKLETNAWFDNNVQKMVSVSASIATGAFLYRRMQRYFSVTDDPNDQPAEKTIADSFSSEIDASYVNVRVGKLINYFPNSSIIAEFDSRVFQVPTQTEVLNYLIWRQQDATRNSIQSVAQSLYSHKELEHKNTSQLQEMIFQKGINWNDFDAGKKRGRVIVSQDYEVADGTVRSRWTSVEPPVFTQDRDFLTNIIPNNAD